MKTLLSTIALLGFTASANATVCTGKTREGVVVQVTFEGLGNEMHIIDVAHDEVSLIFRDKQCKQRGTRFSKTNDWTECYLDTELFAYIVSHRYPYALYNRSLQMKCTDGTDQE